MKSVSAKVGGGFGSFVMDWIVGPASGQRVSGFGWESGASFDTSALHGAMWRRE